MSLSWKTLLVAGNRTLASAAVLGASLFGVALGLAACDLGETTPIPDGAVDDFDGGTTAPEGGATGGSTGTTAGSTGGTPGDAGIQPGQARLANMLQGSGALDFCYRASSSAPWKGPVVGGEGVKYGEVSARFTIEGAVAEKATSFEFGIVPAGAGCTAGAGAPGDGGASDGGPSDGGASDGGASDGGASSGGVTLAPVKAELAGNAALSIVAFGRTGETGAGVPTVKTLPDQLTASSTAIALRAFHASFDTAPVDVVVGGATVLTGIRYGTAAGFPYTSATGFVSVPAPSPLAAGSELVLRAGTTTGTFALPQDIPAGTIVTAFATGRSQGGDPKLALVVCVDNGSSTPLATCAKLAPK